MRNSDEKTYQEVLVVSYEEHKDYAQSILVCSLFLPLSFLHPSIQKFPLGHEGSEGSWMPPQEKKLEEGLGDLVEQRGGEGNGH